MRLTAFVFVFGITFSVFAQSVPKLIEIADELFEAKRYLEAIEFYEKISGIDKRNYEAKYRLGYCYNRTLKYEEAKETFLDLGTRQPNDFQALAIYNYANILKLEQSFLEADSLYSYLITLPSAGSDVIALSRRQKEGCQLAMRQKQEDKGYSVELLEEVNSKLHDFGAVVNPSTKELVFASTRNLPGVQYEGSQFEGVLPDLVAFEKRKNDRWRLSNSGQNFSKLNTQWSEGSGSFTQDGEKFYFYSCRGEDNTDCGIMVSYLLDGKWSEPTILNEYINEPGSENKQPSISATGDTLFFSSDRPGGIGASDIWMSLQGLEPESWTPAINMGDVINTAENDITPYYSSAYSTLIFASNGLVGYGGYDLYAANGESFFEPEVYNLGYPFNSTLDDTYFSISDSVGFLSSNRADKRNLNLYAFGVSNERLFLSLLISGESLIDSRIASKFRDIRSLDLVTFRVEDYQGYELFEPEKRKKPKPAFLVSAEEEGTAANGAASTSAELVTSSSTGQYRYNYETQYFGYGHVMLRPEAKKSLDYLISQLKSKDYSSISVLAYTDQLGADSFNVDLSAKRGLAVKAYLAIKGIPLDKINIFARGEIPPPENRDHIFRRVFSRKVEIVVEAANGVELKKADIYLLRREETPQTLAKKLNLSAQDIIDWNGLKEETIPVASTLRLFGVDNRNVSSILLTSDKWREALRPVN